MSDLSQFSRQANPVNIFLSVKFLHLNILIQKNFFSIFYQLRFLKV